VCNKKITQFYLSPSDEPHLFLIHSRNVSPPFGWSVIAPTH